MRILKNILRVKSYTAMYVLALGIIALMVTGSHLLSTHIITQQLHDAKIINLSGRQRMLSQRIALLTMRVTIPEIREKSKTELQNSIDEMKFAHRILSKDGRELGLTNHISNEIRNMYFDKKYPQPHDGSGLISLDEFLDHFLYDAQRVLQLRDESLTMNNPVIDHVINDYHATLLTSLHAIVMQYEHESEAKLDMLRKAEIVILGAILLAILLIALLIFRPLVANVEKRNSQLRLANQTLRQKHHTEKLAALGELSGGLAHEINNALVPAIGMSEILKKRLRNSQPDLLNFVNIIYDSSMHARKIVQNVLAFARGQDSQNEILAAASLFSDAISLNTSLLKDNITLDVNGLEDVEQQHVYVNKTAVIQIISNLLKNAAEAMPDGGKVTVNFSKQFIDTDFAIEHNLVECDHLVMEVKDTGSGMSDDIIDQIFNPFFTTKDVDQGTGLGLSTVYGIMQNLGGAITVESTEGEGARFLLFFPLTDPALFKPVIGEVKAA